MKWGLILRSLKNREMQKKVLIVIFIVLVFRGLSHIPVPFAEPAQLKQVLDNAFSSAESPQILSFINILSGGALANFSIMLVGLGPYITASIIIQLLTHAFPRLESLQKDEGEYGRTKVNQYTRILTFPLAILQSIGTIFIIRQTANQFGGLGDVLASATMSRWVLMVAALTGGAMILMWLGELLTEQGLGNGISILITVGVVSGLPGIAGQLISATVSDVSNKLHIFGKTLPVDSRGLSVTLVVLILSLTLTVLVVYLNEAQRRITVSYAKRVQGSRSYGGITSVLPIKLIIAGVIPIIFALAFLSIPAFIGQILTHVSNPTWANIGTHMINLFQQPTANAYAAGGWQPYIYPIAYFLLVVMFTFFYTGITFNSKEIAENLQKQGGFIEDKRPGAETEKYLTRIVNRLTLFGSISLGLLAIMPFILLILAVNFPSLPLPTSQIQIGGTSLLILVSVAIETLRQVESRALMLTYDDYGTLPDMDMDEEDKPKKKNIFKKVFTKKGKI